MRGLGLGRRPRARSAPLALPFTLGALLVALGACTRDDPAQLIGGKPSTGGNCPTVTASSTGTSSGSTTTTTTTTTTTSSSSGNTTSSTTGGGTGGGPVAPKKTALDDRTLSYTEALRTASLKLVGDVPTLQQIKDLDGTAKADQPQKYASMIDALLDDVRFKAKMVELWKNTMRMGGAASGPKPSRDTAPTFAARLTVEQGNYLDLFTAKTNTCPTFDGTNFADGNCDNGPVTAGILTDPGVNAQYYGNLAFRRHRFIQEVFVCHKLPAELTKNTVQKGNGTYTSPWPFESIAAPGNGGRIDFLDTSSAICANCHSSANHRAPLFGQFDENGKYQPLGPNGEFAVQIPITDLPFAKRSDWLPEGEPTAWRDPNLPGCMEYQDGLFCNKTANDLGELGALMIQDPEVIACPVRRMWNFALSKGDIVNDAADVPNEVIKPYVTVFTGGNYNLRAVLRAMLVSDDFVRF
ncbi:MAG: hypothetical protein U0359_02960 [Byssovorax sp.]